MKKIFFLLVLLFITNLSFLSAQQITYTEPDREDIRTLNYDIIGKINGNILIYKDYRNVHFISLYDGQMKLTEKNKLEFLPDRILNVDFINYANYFFMIYQYQKKNIVYCMAAKLDGNGKLLNEPFQLDTTEINFSSNNKIYSVINSDDKQKIMIFKINTKHEKENIVTTVLFDNNFNLLHKTRVAILMQERNDFLAQFQLDNDGDLVFIKEWGTAQNDNISKIVLITKLAVENEIKTNDLKLSGLYLDDIRVKIDNFNKHYLVTSFYSKQRRNNVDGLFLYLWDKKNAAEKYTITTNLSDELRNDARGSSSLKTAFNDFFLRNIIMKNDGGFIISAESNYTSIRGNATMNRWDYMNGLTFMPSDYYNYGLPNYYSGSRFNTISQTRYFADNIAVVSFDEKGKIEWSNVVHKSQYDDNTDNYIGYGLINTGDQIHYLFNVQEKRQTVFSDQTISPEGQLTRSATLKNLDRGYEFMPRLAKQVSANQMIVPCQFRNYVCFAKVEI